MMFVYSYLLVFAFAHVSCANEIADQQLLEFLQKHPNPDGYMTTSWGKFVTYEEANYGMNKDEGIAMNPFLYESLSALAQERLPPRVVHAKGAGAFGYFEVTHDVTNITNVAIFNRVGKRTPLVARFSASFGEKGVSDLTSRNKGIAFKLYTEQGNVDITGFSINGFPVKDPITALSFIHSLKENPKTGVLDNTATWDFVVNRPEAMFSAIQGASAGGQPRSYGSMPGFAIHTFQVQNNAGDIYFMKMNWFPNEGIQNFTNAEMIPILLSQPDYHSLELYNRIGKGDFPTFTLCFQVIPKADLHKVPFDIFDTTLVWPADQYPNIPVGKIVLNRNPENYQSQVEMLAFNPMNLPLGMYGLDKIFEARGIVYREGHRHRLGNGFNKIPINCPLNTLRSYSRDGLPPVDDNGRDRPNYYPNSFNGPIPINVTYAPRHRPDTKPTVDNYWLAKKYVDDMSPADQNILITNLGTVFSRTPPLVRDKIMNIWYDIDKSIADRLNAAMNTVLAGKSGEIPVV